MNYTHSGGHHHHHHHHEHAIDASSLNTAFKLGIALNVGFVYDRERHDGACCH
ncbi:MAG: hypothetical protein K2K93_03925 [Muribaculaceae bacterium]|nr:hypothetical protein [Muribaculaceae bacterium]